MLIRIHAKRVLRRLAIAATTALVLSIFIISSAHAVLYKQDKPYYSDIGQFNYARFLANEHGHKAAAREFGRLIENFPGSRLIPEAQLRMGEAYLSAGMPVEAEAQLKLFLANFPESPFVPEAYQLYGQARARLKTLVLEERPQAAELAKGRGEPLVAVQVMFFEGRSYKEIDAELKRLKDAGINTVIARVFHNKGDRFYKVAVAGRGSLPSSGVYFRTSSAPIVADVLSELTTLAHKNGLKLFAWMTTRYADYGVEGNAKTACIGYDIASGKYARCKGLDLFSDEAVARLEAMYSDLASYDIDGILFQDDLVLRHNEGFGQRAEALFKKDTNINADPKSLYIVSDNGATVHYTPLFWKWAAWKNRRLLDIAERLKTAARAKNPSIKFAINMMYESVTNPPYALAWLSQSLEKAVESGFDYYSIMAYHRQMEEELGVKREEVKGMIARMIGAAVKTVGDPLKVLIKFQTIDWRSGSQLSDSEVLSLIQDVRQDVSRDYAGAGAVSMAIVPYRPGFPFFEFAYGQTPGPRGMMR